MVVSKVFWGCCFENANRTGSLRKKKRKKKTKTQLCWNKGVFSGTACKAKQLMILYLILISRLCLPQTHFLET